MAFRRQVEVTFASESVSFFSTSHATAASCTVETDEARSPGSNRKAGVQHAVDSLAFRGDNRGLILK